MLGGEVGFVLTDVEPPLAAGAGATPPFSASEMDYVIGMATILLADDPDAAWSTARARLTADAKRLGEEIAKTTHRDVKIRSLAASERGAAGRAIARVDDFVLFAADAADLEPIIDTAVGETSALSASEPVADLRALLSLEVLVFGYADTRLLLDEVGSGVFLYEELGPFFYVPLGRLNPLLGRQLDALRPAEREALAAGGPVPVGLASHAAFALWADAPGLRADAVYAVTEDGAGTPPPPPDADHALDRRVPADALILANGDAGSTSLFTDLATSFVTIYAGLQGLAESIEGGTPVADLATPAPVDPVAFLQTRFDAVDRVLGFDLRAELTDELVGEYGVFLSCGGTSGLVVSDVADEATVAGSLREIARLIAKAEGAAAVTTREVAGETVHVNAAAAPPVEFGVVDGDWLLGTGRGVDDYVAGPEAPLVEDEHYRRVLATLPSGYSQIAYVNVGGIVDGSCPAPGIGPVDAGSPSASASPEAYPAARSGPIEAFAQVTYVDDGVGRISAILAIAE